ncbi:MAG TPA: ATP-dependent sacrificial sulfur transferase LarE, partial [Candidatus Bathyarchaeia archaeon]|nr:ATP-dependent sacrificial sulfur transferase LarE [Candidatus Bathyarchaeia archaeon]
ARNVLGDRAVAITAVSESLPPGELEIAAKTARQIGIKHITVNTDEVHRSDYKANATDRCYYCKDTLYRELRRQARHLGLGTILDGTHMDDFQDVRPGLLAAREAGVRSPLAEAGFSKEDVRETARLLKLEVWDKPAMACLSSRIPHGSEITVEKLSQVGEAESIVKRLTGARDIRVRHRGSVAAIEMAPGELPLASRGDVMIRLKQELNRIGFTRVVLGPRKRSTARTISPDQSYILPMIPGSNL